MYFYGNDQCPLVLQREQKGEEGKEADSDALKEGLEQGGCVIQDNV